VVLTAAPPVRYLTVISEELISASAFVAGDRKKTATL
jgi:hypothetical protein